MHETEPQPDSQAPVAAPLTVKTDQHPTQAHEEEIDPEQEMLLRRVAELEASVQARAEEAAAERQRAKEAAREAAREQKRAAEKERLAAKMAALEEALAASARAEEEAAAHESESQADAESPSPALEPGHAAGDEAVLQEDTVDPEKEMLLQRVAELEASVRARCKI